MHSSVKARESLITAERARGLLEYNPATGVFRYRVTITGWIRKGEVAGSPGAGGYWQIQIDGNLYLAHRLAFLIVTGEWPVEEVDHEDGNGLHNWWENLRPATRMQNMHNQGVRKNNTSGIPGVSESRRGWVAYITVDNRRRHLGRFAAKEAAIEARRAAEVEFFGEFRRA